MIKSDKILFTGKVVDNEDTFLLNRIRVFPDTDENIEQLLKSEFNQETELIRGDFGLDIIDTLKYGVRDPFVFYPLFPFSLSIIPRLGEMVWVTYSNPANNNGRKEQFYVPTMNSNPFNTSTDTYDQQKTNTSTGFNLVFAPKVKSDSVDVKTGKKGYDVPISGLFAEPGDNAFYGQGTSDIIVKPTEIILRAGKIDNLQPNTINSANEKRGFFQISYFQTKKNVVEPEVVNTEELDTSPLKKLIEYSIINPENTANSFSGNINIYDLPPSPNLQNDKFTADSEIPNTVTTPIWSYPFAALPMSGVTILINDVINALNNGGNDLKTKYPDDQKFMTLVNNIIGWTDTRTFPYYYRPDSFIRNIINTIPDTNDPASFVKISNCSLLISKVKFSSASLDTDGSGLISRKNKFGTSFKSVKKLKMDDTNVLSKNSISVLGSNKIILLSNESGPIPGKKPINLDKKSIYGLTQPEIQENILPNTDCLVRGEKLKELLNLIVKFTTTHTHAFSGTPPVPVSYSSVSVAQIESELQLYDEKVLNQNIRIN